MDSYRWIDCGNGRKVYRKVGPYSGGQKSDLPLPALVRAFSEPVQSMADGKFYDDPASLRNSYKAANNPHGVDFIEAGNERIIDFKPPKKDRKAERGAIERAISEVDSGNAPPLLTKLPTF